MITDKSKKTNSATYFSSNMESNFKSGKVSFTLTSNKSVFKSDRLALIKGNPLTAFQTNMAGLAV